MNSHPGVSEIVALLNALKNVIRDFAARETKLNGDFRAQSAAADKLADEASVKRASKLAEGVDRENAAFEERKQQCQIHYDNRKARINRAHAAVRKMVMDEISEQHGRRKFKIQASTLEAERSRDDALAGTVVTLENFRRATAENAVALDELAQSARRAFGGCGKFRRLLSPNHKWPEPDLAPDENHLFEQQRQLQEKIRGGLGRFKKMPLPLIFRFIPFWLVTLLFLAGAAVLVMDHLKVKMMVPPSDAIVVVAASFASSGGIFLRA